MGEGANRAGRTRVLPVTDAVGRLASLPAVAPRLDAGWVVIGVPVALVVWLALVPLGFLLWQSFLTPQTATLPAHYTLENFRTAYLSSDNARLFFNSLQFATGAAVLSLVVGTGLAWMNERTNTPFKTLFFALTIFILYFVVIVLLPFLVLAWSSLQKFYSAPSWAALSRVSLDSYRAVLEYPQFMNTVWNSVVLALGSATTVMLVSAVIAWIVVRTKVPGRWMLDNLASLPLVFPGLVLGLAIMVCYLYIDIGVYGTLWIMFIAYVTRFLPYGMRYNSASMLQIHKELEESAAMSGASWSMTFRRVVLPLLKPGLLAGWIYVMIVSIREL